MTITEQREEWRDVPGYEGRYRVSTLGRVFSTHKGACLSARIERPLYPFVHLYKNGRGRTIRVHLLVMAVFVGPCPDGHEVRHLNGDSTDSRLSNLAYGTKSQNARDKIGHGTHNMARKTHCKRGHPLTGANLYVYRGGRGCRKCRLIAKRKYRAGLALAR